LSYRYQYGHDVSLDIETAAQYSYLAAQGWVEYNKYYNYCNFLRYFFKVAKQEFHKFGGQPVLEADRINDNTAAQIPKGNTGNDDELIQHQIVRAKEGDIPSILAMGDLYYYGARGMPRLYFVEVIIFYLFVL
jgi:TPR repeat protein